MKSRHILTLAAIAAVLGASLVLAQEAGDPKPDSYYWLYGGSFGGPIIPDQTFFWASTEGYRTSVTRNQVVTFPTEAMARGDFSHSGITIYDPLTTRSDPNNPGEFVRDPFPGNVIPADRLNPVGLNLASYLLGMGSGSGIRETVPEAVWPALLLPQVWKSCRGGHVVLPLVQDK